jgi:hypothetical protein
MYSYPKDLMKVTVELGNVKYVMDGYGTLNVDPGKSAQLELTTLVAGYMNVESASSPEITYGSVYGDKPFDADWFDSRWLDVWPGVGDYVPRPPVPRLWKQNKETEKVMEKFNVNNLNVREDVLAKLRWLAYVAIDPAGHKKHEIVEFGVTEVNLANAYSGHGLIACTNCKGLRATVSGTTSSASAYYCGHCDGTGIEPKPKTRVVPISSLTFQQCLNILTRHGWFNAVEWINNDNAAYVRDNIKISAAQAVIRVRATETNTLLDNDSIEISND